MKKLSNIYILILVTIFGHSLNAQVRRSKEKVTPFENFTEAKNYIKEQSNKDLFSGNVLVKNKNDEIIKEAYGLASKEDISANNIDTKINIGSINKVFTSVCVMQLVEQGKIKLEDKIIDYIPELKIPKANQITIFNLLEMKSGLGSYFNTPYFQKHYRTLKNLENYLPAINELEVNSTPGTKFAYSNASYELLGILIQRVSGKNYYEYVKENVYDKAGMENTDAYERDAKTTNLAQGYSKYELGESFSSNHKGSFDNNVNDWHPVKGTAAGGGYSTVDDFYKFMVALVENKLISKKSTDMVINKFRPFREREAVFNVRGGSYGISATISYDIKNETAIIVLSNYDTPMASLIANKLMETIQVQQ